MYGSSSGHAVDGDPALGVAAHDVVAADADDPLDEVASPFGGAEAEQPGERRDAPCATGLPDARRVDLGREGVVAVEDDDVAALDVVRTR